MLASIKLASMAASIMLSTFQSSNLEASAHATPLHTTGAVTEYSIEDSGSPVLASWKAEAGKQKAIILAIHGFGLHKYAFLPFAERMRLRGVSTYALDIRGFGGWAQAKHGDRSLNLQKAVADIKDILQGLKDENPNTPIFLLGESMGGALALKVASSSPELVTGVISSVPSGQLFQKKALVMELTLRYFLNGGHRIDIGQQILSKTTADQGLLRRWLSDSRVRTKVGKLELLQFSRFMGGNDKVAKSLTNTAVLMLQGDQDRLIQPAGTEHLYKELPTKDKTMLVVSGGEHLLIEQGQFDEGLLNNVTAWVRQHSSSQDAIVANNY
jgi:acylglycerol lipase